MTADGALPMAAPRRRPARPPRPRAFESVCERVRRDLVSGVLRPGDKLPAERDLAEHLGVGRGAVREALRTLETSGVLELKTGVAGGAFVRAVSSRGLATSMHDLMFIGHTPLKQLTEVRAQLLGFAVELACARGTASDFDAIAANIDLTEALGRTHLSEDLIEAINHFYDLVAAAAHNQILATLIGSFAGVMHSIQSRLKGWIPADFPATRRRILSHMRARDPVAAVAEVRRHLEDMQTYILSHAPDDFRQDLAG